MDIRTPEEIVAFTVPLTPVSVNHHTRPCKYIGRDGYLHTGRKLTKQARAFYDAVSIFSAGRTVSPVTEAERRMVRYSITADVYLGFNQRMDADNAGKQICDSLVKAHVIHSDAFVFNCQITIHKDQRTNPRTEYLVTRLEK